MVEFLIFIFGLAAGWSMRSQQAGVPIVPKSGGGPGEEKPKSSPKSGGGPGEER